MFVYQSTRKAKPNQPYISYKENMNYSKKLKNKNKQTRYCKTLRQHFFYI